MAQFQFQLLVEELESEQASLNVAASSVHWTCPVHPTSLKASPHRPAPTSAHRRQRCARKPLPDHLPRERVVHQPANTGRCACEDCNGALRLLGQDVAEVLENVPARFVVIRHVQPKYTCTKCQAIVQAAAPGRPIARGLTVADSPGHVLVSKYACHLPPYRQSEIYAREGV